VQGHASWGARRWLEPPLLGLLVLGWTSPTDGSCARHRELMVGWVNRVLANLERWFASGRDYVATPDFTVADIPDGARAHLGHQGREADRAVSGTRGVSQPVPGAAGWRGSGRSRRMGRGWRRGRGEPSRQPATCANVCASRANSQRPSGCWR